MQIIKSIFAFAILVLCWLSGQVLSQYVALPGTVLGLLFLFILLVCTKRLPKSLVRVSQFSLRHLAFFFIPPLLAAWAYIEQLGDQVWLFMFAIGLSTFLSLLITAWLGQRLFTLKKDEPDGQ